MIKVGDIIFAREEFMRNYPSYDSRRFVVEKVDLSSYHTVVSIVNYDNNEQNWIGKIDPDYFFFFDDMSLNKDIYEALERYEFQSFQGVTLEGKIIQLDLPNPSTRKIIK